MDVNLKKVEEFFKYDLKIKTVLYNIVPKEQYRYNKNSLIEYSDNLYECLNDIEFYLKKILTNFELNYTKFIDNLFNIYRDKLLKCNYDFDKLKIFYKACFSDMDTDFINNVRNNSAGYSFKDPIFLIEETNSINEILHVLHSSIVNNENYYSDIPILQQKYNDENYPIVLRGKDNVLVRKIYESFPNNMDCGNTEILSLSNNILLMVRDKGHALLIEISVSEEDCFIRYFIPKICNVKMINKLKGIKKIHENSTYAVGDFSSNFEEVPKEIINLIRKVPTDVNMFTESGQFYNDIKTK